MTNETTTAQQTPAMLEKSERLRQVAERLRDDFAIAALTGLLAESHKYLFPFPGEEVAQCAYRIADAMLRARKVPSHNPR